MAPSGKTLMATMLCVASPTGIMGGCAQSNCFASAFLYQLPNTVLGALAEDIQHSQHGSCDQMLDDIIHGAHMLASHLQKPLCKIVDKSGRLQILKTLGCRFHLPKYGRHSHLQMHVGTLLQERGRET